MVLRKLGAKAKKILKDSRTRRRRDKARKKKLSKEVKKIQREAYSTSYKEQAKVEAIRRGIEDAQKKGRKGGGFGRALDILTNIGNTDFLGGFTIVDPSAPREHKRKNRKKKTSKKRR